MLTNRQLDWVRRNRAGKEAVQRAGMIVARVAGRLDQETLGVCREIGVALADLVDGDFRRHCRVAGLRGGTLVITVDHPARVASMRLARLTAKGFLNDCIKTSAPTVLRTLSTLNRKSRLVSAWGGNRRHNSLWIS